MNPENIVSWQLREERAEFFANMKLNGVGDEDFLRWFWIYKYKECQHAVLLTCAAMYEGWKGAKKFG